MGAPTYASPRIYPQTRGDDFVDFARMLLTATRGRKKGLPLEMMEWQVQLLRDLFEEKPDGFLRYRTAIIGMPRKNGKSLLGTDIALCALYWSDGGSQIYSAAKDREQARIVFDEAKAQIERSPQLRKVFKVYRDKIVSRRSGASYRVLSADAGSAQGLGPSILIADELHAWTPGRGEELWTALTSGSTDRDESLVVGITTAGSDHDSLLGKLYDDGVKMCTGAQSEDEFDETFGFWWWEAPDDADIMDPATWAIANPNFDLDPSSGKQLLSEEALRSQLRKAIARGDIGAFERYHLNRWVRADGKESFLTEHQWKESIHPEITSIPKGAKVVCGFDGSLGKDSTGIVMIDMTTGFIELFRGWDHPGHGAEWEVPRDEVHAAVHELFRDYAVQMMWCDTTYWETDVLYGWARDYPGRVQDVPQQHSSRMVNMTKQFKADLVSGKLWHADGGRLRSHFLNAIEDSQGRARKETPKSRLKVDYLICAILANGAYNRLAHKIETPDEEAQFIRLRR